MFLRHSMAYACPRIRLILLSVLFFAAVSLSSSLATFRDEKCQASLEGINGPNGYPNGTCTPLDFKGHNWKSFQIVGLDPGCAATIYGKDKDADTPCSSETLEFAHIATCYNTSWVYYSIDNCDPPGNSLTSSTTSPTSTSAISASPSETPQGASAHSTGAIAGGVVGGVMGLALMVGLALWYLRSKRNRQPTEQPDIPQTPLAELSPHHGKQEIYSHEALPPQEIGRTSVYVDPAELHGTPMGTGEGGLFRAPAGGENTGSYQK